MLHGQQPDYEHLRIIGSLCFAHNQRRNGDKFASRSKKCVFMGYPYGKKGWKLFDLETEDIFVSRDVEFVETKFPFATDITSIQDGLSSNWNFEEFVNDFDGEEETDHTLSTQESNDMGLDNVNGKLDVGIVAGSSQYMNTQETTLSPMTSATSDNEEVDEQDDDLQNMDREDTMGPSIPVIEPMLGRGHRIKQPSTRLQHYVTNTARKLSPSNRPPSPKANSGAPYPITNYVNYDHFSIAHRVFLSAVSQEKEPITYADAMKDSRWREAMQSEIRSLETNGTWTVTELPPGKKALGCKWVYKIKHKSDGSVERFKARLVILGNHQKEGVDYTETFAPVVKMVTIRTVLAVAAMRDWELHQMDVHNAFLHGDLEEIVYMKPPPGFLPQRSGTVCKLNKSLYGLKQAPRCWFAKLSASLKHYGFLQSRSDYSLFVLQKPGVHLVVLVYVDDLIITGDNHGAITDFKAYLHDCFHMKD
jgi:hypothetical protein